MMSDVMFNVMSNVMSNVMCMAHNAEVKKSAVE